jgi:hypothetical protein
VLPEECDKPYIRVRGVTLGGRYKIANVLTPVYDNIHSREAEETRANARLIAAAPELLAALESISAWMESQADGQSKGGHATFDLMMLRGHRDAARAAIAATTGAAA